MGAATILEPYLDLDELRRNYMHICAATRSFLRYSKLAVSAPFGGPQKLARFRAIEGTNSQKVANFWEKSGPRSSDRTGSKRPGGTGGREGRSRQKTSRKVANFRGNRKGSGTPQKDHEGREGVRRQKTGPAEGPGGGIPKDHEGKGGGEAKSWQLSGDFPPLPKRLSKLVLVQRGPAAQKPGKPEKTKEGEEV